MRKIDPVLLSIKSVCKNEHEKFKNLKETTRMYSLEYWHIIYNGATTTTTKTKPIDLFIYLYM